MPSMFVLEARVLWFNRIYLVCVKFHEKSTEKACRLSAGREHQRRRRKKYPGGGEYGGVKSVANMTVYHVYLTNNIFHRITERQCAF